MDEVKLSIIIPLYNGKEFIKETVEEVLKIKSKKEIIIVDDGSTDGSFKYCLDLWNSIPNIKLFTKKNGGIVDARNYGMQKAHGVYLFFVDQDDMVFPDVIDMAVEQAEREHLEGVIWSTVRLVNNGQLVPCDTVQKDCIATKNEINDILLPSMLTNEKNQIVSYTGHVWAGIYRTDIIKANDIWFKRFVDIEDDYLFVFDFLNVALRIGFIKKTGYAWRYNQKSETYRQKYIDNIVERYQKFYGYLDKSIEKSDMSDADRKKYLQYRIQNTLVMSMENSYTCLNHSNADKKKIKEYYISNKKYFRKESLYEYAKRRKRIYWCLRHNLFWAACIYVYLDSIYRKYKHFMVH